MIWFRFFIFAGLLCLCSSTHAQLTPPCFDGKSYRRLEIDNQRILTWNKTPISQKRIERALIRGVITKIVHRKRPARFPGTYHTVIDVRLGTLPDDVIRLYYNLNHGALPKLRIGTMLTACGEYIKYPDYFRDQTQRYHYNQTETKKFRSNMPIMHYLHRSQNLWRSGFLMIDGVVYGNS
ncbi:MAG: hypothetical protein SFW63_07355 [Alphaproteobacteria bacterium]|nr:hypothetical protein [Alphaproteobacteria bacterium]